MNMEGNKKCDFLKYLLLVNIYLIVIFFSLAWMIELSELVFAPARTLFKTEFLEDVTK